MFEQELTNLKKSGLARFTRSIESPPGPRVTISGREVLLLCSNDYLGLANHPVIVSAAQDAIKRFGFGSGASRLVSGNTILHEKLERAIALFKETESAILFNSGYTANIGVIPAVADEKDAIFSDSLNHASIIDGCRLSRAKTFVYRHRDMNHLEDLLKTGVFRKRFIVTDGVFSMDGDIAPLPEIVALAERHNAFLIVDDAHATGVIGKTGKGTAEHFNLHNKVALQMGTLSKALGAYGAYIAASKTATDFLFNKVRSYIFSTSLPPAACAASIAGIEIIQSEPWRREKLHKNTIMLCSGLREIGVDAEYKKTPIISITIGEAEQAVAAAAKLFELGIFTAAIRPPSVPEGTSRLRITVTAMHTDQDIESALHAFKKLQNSGLLNNVVRK